MSNYLDTNKLISKTSRCELVTKYIPINLFSGDFFNRNPVDKDIF